MRTKALLTLAAFVVSAGACVAQTSNVYSLNIVGYVNVPITNGMNLIANPLKPSNGNYNITNTITLPDTAADATIYTWAGTGWAATTPQWIPGFGWDPGLDIQLGTAFFLKSPVNTQVTFVGEVQTGNAIQYTINQGMNAVANEVPVDERYPGNRGTADDTIYLWNTTSQAWSSEVWQFIDGFGWDNGQPNSDVNGPLIKAGQGLFYNAKAPLAWTRSFNP